MSILNAQVFGFKHLTGLLAIVFLIVLLLYLCEKKFSDKQRIVLIVSTIFILALEIAKLGFLIVRDGSFPMNHLPLQLCSLPLYLVPILAFAKPKSKVLSFVKPAAYATVLFGGMVALLLPFNVIGNAVNWVPLSGNILPIRSFLFHGEWFLLHYI